MKSYVLIGAAALILLAGGIGYYYETHRTENAGGIACTQEAMQCPDGSYVGRAGPDCAFAPCPTGTTPATGAPVVGVGAHCGGFIKDAPVCAAGLHCQLKISNPDTGGTCVAD